MKIGAHRDSQRRVVANLLQRLLPRGEADVIIGDLLELHAAHAARGRLRAAVWLWLQVFAAPARARMHGIRRALGARRRSPLIDAPRPTPRLGSAETMTSFAQDLRHALRGLRRTPVFALVVLTTIAVGIGATTAIYSVVHGVLLDPGHFPYYDRMVYAPQLIDDTGTPAWYWSYTNFHDVRDRAESFAMLEGVFLGSAVLTGGEAATQVFTRYVTSGYLDMFGARIHLGRMIGEEDQRVAGQHAVTVITHSLWQSYFGGDPEIVGRRLFLSGQPYTVIGVLNPGFEYPYGQDLGEVIDVWLPASMIGAFHPRGHEFLSDRSAPALSAIGVLAEGVTVAQADAELNAIADELERTYPDTNAGVSAVVIDYREAKERPLRMPLLLLFGGAVALLLIGCANVANLMLVRAAGRRRELALRMALGSGRARLVRYLTTEGLVLAFVGGGMGVFLAWAGLPLLLVLVEGMLRVNSTQLPPQASVAISVPVLVAAVAASLAAGLTFGLAPAWRVTALDLAPQLSSTERHGLDWRASRVRRGLVVVEVAVATMLLAASGLMLETIATIQATDVGFRTDRSLVFRVSLPQDAYPTPEERLVATEAIAEALTAAPEIEWAGPWAPRPIAAGAAQAVAPAGTEIPAGGSAPTAYLHTVGAGALGRLDIELIAGREFTPADATDSAPVAIVSESLAARLWPGREAVGQLLTPYATVPDESDAALVWRVVGVARDVLMSGRMPAPEDGSRPADDLYLPVAQLPPDSAPFFIAQTAGTPDASIVRDAIRAVDPNLPMYEVASIEELLARLEGPTRFSTALMSAFSSVALLLAAVGVYGIFAFAVRERSGEIGLRAALGASSTRTMNLFLREALTLAITGTLLGSLAAAGLQRLIGSVVAGMADPGPLVLVGPALALLLIAMLACYLPARRATRVDPVIALRS